MTLIWHRIVFYISFLITIIISIDSFKKNTIDFAKHVCVCLSLATRGSRAFTKG